MITPEYYIDPKTLKPYISLDTFFQLLDDMMDKTKNNYDIHTYLNRCKVSLKDQFNESLGNIHFKQLGI